jgi:hypothetical protein
LQNSLDLTAKSERHRLLSLKSNRNVRLHRTARKLASSRRVAVLPVHESPASESSSLLLLVSSNPQAEKILSATLPSCIQYARIQFVITYTVESVSMARMTILEGREGLRTRRTGREDNACILIPLWRMAFKVWEGGVI